VDYIELDAASNRGVDDMTSLLEKATYAPTRGRFKVYVIDEVHQLSGHAFNAMLKTLEEPPAHVKFILATTDPQKIPVTVLSRCLQFNLKQMSPGHIVDHLSYVLTQENVPFAPSALRQLAKSAAGSMRDALSLLDQAIAHGAGKVEEAGVRDMLGTVGDDYLFAVLDGLKDGNIQAMLDLADDMDERSLSFESALQELATLFHRIALLQFAPQAIADDAERSRLSSYAAAFDAEFLQLCYQIAIHGRDEIGLAPDEYAGFAMTLLRLFAFRPEAGTPLAVGAGKATSAAPASALSAAPSAESAPLQPVLAKASATDDWQAVVARLPGMARQLAQYCQFIERKDGRVRLQLDPAHPHLQQHQDKLRVALSELWGDLRLEITLAAPDVATPAAQVKQEKRERQEKAITAIEQDPFVRATVDVFNARIDTATIKPV
jgi:DNA polymerase-3 subunit gamma/tau